MKNVFFKTFYLFHAEEPISRFNTISNIKQINSYKTIIITKKNLEQHKKINDGKS